MAQLKLTYFDFSGSRGEECRLALFVAGADFEDHRIQREQWSALKPATPFGSLPILEVAGQPPLGQSNAILLYVGREYALLPREPWEAARHTALLAVVEDLRAAMMPLTRIQDPAEQKTTRHDFIAGPLHDWAQHIEQQISGPFVAGSELSVADIKLFVIAHSLSSGVYDHFPQDVLAPFPKLTALYRAVGEHPKVAEWRAGRASA